MIHAGRLLRAFGSALLLSGSSEAALLTVLAADQVGHHVRDTVDLTCHEPHIEARLFSSLGAFSNHLWLSAPLRLGTVTLSRGSSLRLSTSGSRCADRCGFGHRL
jgi:hypothetical protein